MTTTIKKYIGKKNPGRKYIKMVLAVFFFFCFSVVAIAYYYTMPKHFKLLNLKDLLDIEIYSVFTVQTSLLWL